MRCSAFAVLVGSLALAGAAATPQHPDFSGTYALARLRSTLMPRAAAMDSAVVRIEHREPAFRFQRVFHRGPQSDTLVLVLTTDGREHATSESEVRSVATLSWEGDTLVFRDRMEAPWGAATDVVRYWLEDSGRTLEARETFRGARVSYDNVWVFERRD